MNKFKVIPKSQIDKLPKTAGVYLFYENKPTPNIKHPTPMYIGKAIHIKDRVKNHFQQPSYKDNLFIKKINKIGFINTDSEIEALILEANLIKKHQPRFNVVWRDDKNYFYVAIAQNRSKIPYIFITHQIDKSKIINHKSKITYIGPFVEGNALKKTLKYLRRIFPYYTSIKHPITDCTWCHLELCPGPNPNIKEYKNNIKKLVLILHGKRKIVLNKLKYEMQQLSKINKYEEALKIRDKMHSLEQVMAHVHLLETRDRRQETRDKRQGTSILDGKWLKTEKILREILSVKKPISKIECYDISNIQGKYATGSMAVFIDGKPDKSQYKKFKIKMKNEPNDIAMLKEVLMRRLAHSEWTYPDLILIDGGKAQLNAAIEIKKSKTELPFMETKVKMRTKASSLIKNQNYKSKLKIISLAKKHNKLFAEGRKDPVLLRDLPRETAHLLLWLRDAAHR